MVDDPDLGEFEEQIDLSDLRRINATLQRQLQIDQAQNRGS